MGINHALEQNAPKQDRRTISFICFLLWTFVIIARPQDWLPFLMFLRPVRLMMGLTILFMFLEQTSINAAIFRLREVRLTGVFYTIVALGIPFAVHPRVAFDFASSQFLTTLIYFFLALIQLRSPHRLTVVARVITVAILFSSINYTLIAGSTVSQGFRVSAGETYDPNDIAMVFVTFLPICLYVFFSKVRIFEKILSGLAILFAVMGVMFSGSRGGVLALLVPVVGLFTLKIPQLKKTLKVLIVLVVVWVTVNFSSTVETRFQGIEEDYNITAEGGRLDVWRENLEILAERPILGVGANCSSIALGLRRLRQGGFQAWQVTHCSPLQVAVETGIPGFIIYTILSIGAIRNLRRIRRSKDHGLSLLSSFAELSLYAFWVAGLFLSHGYSSHLFVLLGMAASIRYLDNQWRASAMKPV